jgi:hypothetical protein
MNNQMQLDARVAKRATTEQLLLIAGAHAWTPQSAEAYRRQVEDAHRPLIKRMKARWPYSLLFIDFVLIAVMLGAVEFMRPGYPSAGIALGALGLLIYFSATNKAWSVRRPEDYDRLIPEAKVLMKQIQSVLPRAKFRLWTFGADPVLEVGVVDLDYGVRYYPILIWDDWGNIVHPPV